MLVEKFVPGRELTVAVMGDKAVAVTELRPRTSFYDYEAKYTDGITEHLIPAPIPAEVYEQAQAMGADGASGAGLPRRSAAPTCAATTASPARRAWSCSSSTPSPA